MRNSPIVYCCEWGHSDMTHQSRNIKHTERQMHRSAHANYLHFVTATKENHTVGVKQNCPPAGSPVDVQITRFCGGCWYQKNSNFWSPISKRGRLGRQASTHDNYKHKPSGPFAQQGRGQRDGKWRRFWMSNFDVTLSNNFHKWQKNSIILESTAVRAASFEYNLKRLKSIFKP